MSEPFTNPAPTDRQIHGTPRWQELGLQIHVTHGDPQIAAEQAEDTITKALEQYGGEGIALLEAMGRRKPDERG